MGSEVEGGGGPGHWGNNTALALRFVSVSSSQRHCHFSAPSVPSINIYFFFGPHFSVASIALHFQLH